MSKCNCLQSQNIYEYKYVIIDKHMGFIDYDDYVFNPYYCPFCGTKLIEDDYETD